MHNKIEMLAKVIEIIFILYFNNSLIIYTWKIHSLFIIFKKRVISMENVKMFLYD